jgi:hypothetical protein
MKENSTRTPIVWESAFAYENVDAAAKTLGSISGLTEGRAFLYKEESAVSYTPFTPTAQIPDITGLPAGSYKLRYQDTETRAYTREDTVVIAPSVPWNDGTLTVDTGIEELTVNFTAPFDGGAPITRYKVTVSSGDFGEVPVDEIEIFMPVPDTETLFDALDPETEYTIRVYAYNGVGAGDGYGAPWETKATPESQPVSSYYPPSKPKPEEPDAQPKTFGAYLTGYEDDIFAPQGNVTRASAAVILARIAFGGVDIPNTYAPSFTDVPTDAWYRNAAGYMEHLGIMVGSDGRFRPGAYVTREEFAKIAVLTAVHVGLIESVETGESTFIDASDISPWAVDYVYTAQIHGYFVGDDSGRLLPRATITRACAASVINAVTGRKITLESIEGFNYRKFSDVSESDWAFADIVAATNSFTLTADGKIVAP